MKIRIHLLIVLASLFAFSGCIETQVLVTVNDDGSGTIREYVKMNKLMLAPLQEMAQQMKQAAEESGADTEQDAVSMEPFSDKSVRENAAKLGKGVRYVSHEKLDTEEAAGYTAMYAFDNIEAVRISQDPAAAVPELGESEGGADMEAEGEGEADGEFVVFGFTPGNPATLLIRSPEQGADESEETGVEEESSADDEGQNAEEGFEQMKEFFRDMKLVVQVAVDGKIAETNASYVDGSTVTLMDIDFNKILDDPEMLSQLKDAEDMDPKAAKELLKKIPGLRVETEDVVTVKFR